MIFIGCDLGSSETYIAIGENDEKKIRLMRWRWDYKLSDFLPVEGKDKDKLIPFWKWLKVQAYGNKSVILSEMIHLIAKNEFFLFIEDAVFMGGKSQLAIEYGNLREMIGELKATFDGEYVLIAPKDWKKKLYDNHKDKPTEEQVMQYYRGYEFVFEYKTNTKKIEQHILDALSILKYGKDLYNSKMKEDKLECKNL